MLAWFAIGWVYWLASGHAPATPPPSKPVARCRHCGAPMNVVQVVDYAIDVKFLNFALAYFDSG